MIKEGGFVVLVDFALQKGLASPTSRDGERALKGRELLNMFRIRRLRMDK